MRKRDHVIAFLLPFFVLVVIPFCLLFYSNDMAGGWNLPYMLEIITVLFGLILIVFGLFLMVIAIRLFHGVGKGTLAPWAPPQNLVVEGIYQRTRNPMISGVVLIAFGEGVIFSSFSILCWALLFLILNHLYFIIYEEPGLQRRFGEEYNQYKVNVPRWFPRRIPWNPNHESAE